MSPLPAPGAKAPSFTLGDADGRLHRFDDVSAHPATLLLFFKRDCATCDLTAPVVERIVQTLSPVGLNVLAVSQSSPVDTAAFTHRHGLTLPVVLDRELDVSQAYGFDAVPALVLTAADRTVLTSFEGWSKADFQELVSQAATLCNVASPAFEADDQPLPAQRPGCASLVHDPDVARRLAVRRGAERLASRRIRIPAGEGDDAIEFLYDRGLTDGLPVVPPTEPRVVSMLEGTSRGATEIVAHVPPNLAPATVEKIAVNAVMAGCRPEYLPVVLAAVEAACTDQFNLHGVLATTYFAGPVIVVNGPIRREIGVNCGRNAFGQGTRANATIGRALQLVVRNLGGGRPGEVDMATLGQPGKYTCCIGENEEESLWEPLHVERGFSATQSTVTLFAGEAPRAVRDERSRAARSLAASLAMALDSVAHTKLHGMGEVLLVVSPEHNRTLVRDGFTKDDLRARIQDVTARPLRQLLPDDECENGTPIGVLPPDWIGPDGAPTEAALDQPFAKYANADDILIVVAGGTAGKHSAIVGGWTAGGLGSAAVTKEIS